MPFLPTRTIQSGAATLDWFSVTNELKASRRLALSKIPTDPRNCWIKVPGALDQWPEIDFSVTDDILTWTNLSDLNTLLQVGTEICVIIY